MDTEVIQKTKSTGSSRRRSGIIVGLLALTLLVLAVFYITQQTQFDSQEISDESKQKEAEAVPNVNVIYITPGGFAPDSLVVPFGTTVKFVNLDDGLHGVTSTAEEFEESSPSFGSISSLPKGGNYTYTFDQTGTWGYYDPLNPTDFQGEIVVTD